MYFCEKIFIMAIFKYRLKNLTARVVLFAKFSAFAVVSVTLFSGCIREYYTTCDHDYAAMDTYYFSVKPNEWIGKPDSGGEGDGPYFFYTYRLPKITANVIKEGVVLCYFIDNDGRDNLLPYLRPWDFDNYGKPYFQNIRFDVENVNQQGFITFIIEANDFDFPNRPDRNMEFKVVVIQNYRH